MLPMRVRRNGGSLLDSPFDLFGREIGRIFNEAWDTASSSGAASYPVDIREDAERLYVDAELPGFKRDEINVTLENGILTIQAERKNEERPGQAHLTERRFMRVSRSFALPNTVDENKVDAHLEDGVLHLTLHKREEVKPRKIQVK